MLCDACSLASVLAAFHLHLPSAGTDLLHGPVWGTGLVPCAKAPAAPGSCTALPLGARLGQFCAGQKHHVVGHAANSGLPLFSRGASDSTRIPLALLLLLCSRFLKPLNIFDWQQTQDTSTPIFFLYLEGLQFIKSLAYLTINCWRMTTM